MLIVFLMDQNRGCTLWLQIIDNTLTTCRLQLSCIFFRVEFVQFSGLLIVQSCRHGIELVTFKV